MIVHYNTTTGQIMLYGYGATDDKHGDESYFPGCKIAVVKNQDIDPTRQMINLKTLKVNRKRKPDTPPDHRPQRIKAAIARELLETDQFMMIDRPMDDGLRTEWKTYRQALRDLKGTPEEILAAWPIRPDSINVAEQWKAIIFG